jgi:hypothetical protein
VKKLIALTALAVAPLAAQTFELGLNISKQTYAEPSATVPVFGTTTFSEDSKTAVAGRFGVALVDVGPVLFQLTAAYQPQVTTTVGVKSGLGSGTLGDYKQGYWGAGAALTFKAVLAVGVGLEYRSEKLDGKDTVGNSSSTTYGRPWFRANFGYAFPTPLVKPFIGLEVGVPLAKKDLDANTSSSEDFLKTLAPKNQIGIYGGIRF